MKFSASSTDLQKVLGLIGGVIPQKSTLPILENFLFQVAKDQLKITATDLDISMSISVKVQSGDTGTIAIPAKRLFETIRALPSTEVTFNADPESNRIVMVTSNGEYKLTGEPTDTYPTIPSFKGDEEIKIDNDMLRRLITKTIFAVSSDELRPAMMGILLQIHKDELRAVATDGHRMVRLIVANAVAGAPEREVIVPAKALNLALRSASNSTSGISFNDTHVMFTLGESTLISRMIEEKYPNYESVIPMDNDRKMIVDRNQLLASVRRTALYASSTTHQVRFSLKKGSMSVSAEDIDFGSEARETLSCDYADEPMEIGFNSMYIIDILSHVDTDEALFLFSSPTRACIVQPTTQREGENMLMLLMPVRLNA